MRVKNLNNIMTVNHFTNRVLYLLLCFQKPLPTRLIVSWVIRIISVIWVLYSNHMDLATGQAKHLQDPHK